MTRGTPRRDASYRAPSPAPPRTPPRLPCALTLAGLDPSSGAGLAADLRGFAAAGAWGCAACAVLTVQSTAGLRSVLATPAEHLRAQADEILAHQRVRALKTGALGSAANVRVATELLRGRPRLPSVVDPVMIATRSPDGARLLDDEALAAMRELCAAAALVTPNLDEAEALLEGRIRDLADQREAALELVGRGARAAVVKGGHLEGDEATDVLAAGKQITLLRARRRQRADFHGGGCLFASLSAGYLAVHPGLSGPRITAAVTFAKTRLTAAINQAADVGDGLLVPWASHPLAPH